MWREKAASLFAVLAMDMCGGFLFVRCRAKVRKGCVSLYWPGCTAASTHRCDPTTEQHGGFDLLRFRPGPIHPALSDLVTSGYPRTTMWILVLVRTPVRHRRRQSRTPDLKQSYSLSLPAAGSQVRATAPGEFASCFSSLQLKMAAATRLH